MTVTRAHITRRASRDGVPAKTVERDYVLSHAIAAIASTNGPQRAAFKGGTCLRFLHFAEYRYSADLDFSVLQGTKDEVLFQFADAFKKADVGAELRLTDGSPPRIAFTGPLGKERTIKLDLADDEYVVHTTRFPLLRRWPDLPDVQVLAYTPLEVCAEKLRCVLQRLQCRDLYDLHTLFERALVDPYAASQLFQAKAAHRGLNAASFPKKYLQRVEEYKKRWASELQNYVAGEIPHFDALERSVARRLRSVRML